LRFSGLILENIFMVFLGSPCRETAKKRDKKIDGKRRQDKSLFLVLNLFGQKFLTWTFPKTQKEVNGVFFTPLVEKRH
jgi:hypothetical protein